MSLAQALLAYRDLFSQERSFGRLKNKPLSLSPMFLQREDHATGLVRLLSIAVLTFLEFSVRQQLTQQRAVLAGLYPGHPKRTTARPTTERLLSSFDNITLTMLDQHNHTSSYITPLSPLQLRILVLLDFSPIFILVFILFF